MKYDVLIVGGGPAGLSAALALGRAKKRVLLCDAGTRRNAAARQMHNFVTRDGTPPDEFRRLGRAELATYPNVEIRDVYVGAITGEKGAFLARVGDEAVEARRIVLSTGMIDEALPFEGAAELWGHSIVQCPYCHGWEARDRKWGFVAPGPEGAGFATMLRGWTRDVVFFTNGGFELAEEARTQLEHAGVRIETRPITRLLSESHELTAVQLEGGERVECELLFAHPPQRQVPLIASIGVRLDEHGYVQVDPMMRSTSVPGIYAAGDLTTRMQAAIAGAAAGMQTGAVLNHELTHELLLEGVL